MGQFTVTLPDDLEKEVRDKVRKGNYATVSDFVRDAIKNELSDRPTYWERFIASAVLENNKLLKAASGKNDWESDELLTALQRGYVGQYNQAEYLVSHDTLTQEGTKFVCDVLEMYGELQRGYDMHGHKDVKLGKAVEFEGFDGNAGDGYLGYASFLVDNGRFAFVRPLDKTPHLNSHHSVNAMYVRMLDEYLAIKEARPRYEYRELDLDEIKQILAAQVHPENR